MSFVAPSHLKVAQGTARHMGEASVAKTPVAPSPLVATQDTAKHTSQDTSKRGGARGQG